MSTNSTSRWHNKLTEQYLNTFFRETQVDINQCIKQASTLTEDQHSPLSASLLTTNQGVSMFCYRFSASDTYLWGGVKHLSLTGYHEYAENFYLVKTGNEVCELTDLRDLLQLISAQLTADAGNGKQEINAGALLNENMNNSVNKSEFFLLNRKQQQCKNAVVEDFIAAEQGMVLGHPFHVTSKASIGFSQDDMKRYSPELGVSFKLHYFAVCPGRLRASDIGEDLTALSDKEAQQQAQQLLTADHKHYTLLPCHPWQANYLLDNQQVQQALADESMISLGPLGQVVWPTSSVRTVWLPENKIFLKLALDVRLTNFVRNNPDEQVMRAIDASRLIRKIPAELSDNRLLLLPELASQTLHFEQAPELSASFASIYRAGLDETSLGQTRILGSLVEENLDGEDLPLWQYIKQAAELADTPLSSDFIEHWWQAYIQASLLPALSLYANTGISLEAHLQNSLMRFEQGMPVQLVVRDMEGVSISRNSVLADACPQVSANSSVWYTPEQTWFRFKYYMVVNHIAHVIAAIARVSLVSESRLWLVTRQCLAAEEMTPATRIWAQRLLEAKDLPAKANMLSSFKQSGEAPTWVDIANPLYFLPQGQDMTLITTSDHNQNNAAFAAAHQQAELRVNQQLFEALIFEGVAVVSRHENNEITLKVSEVLTYRCQGITSDSFERIRLVPGSLMREEQITGQNRISRPSLQQLMTDLAPLVKAEPQKWQQFHDELTLTRVKHAQTLHQLPAKPLRDMSYEFQEARVNNGHLYHPSFKSRIGFDLAENQLYGPELSQGYHVIWLAVHQDYVHACVGNSTSLEQIYGQHFTPQELQAINSQVEDAGADLENMRLLPVHPWQWHKIISLYYQDLLTSGMIIKLAVSGPKYLPQQSIRTLSNMDDVKQASIKLAMNLVNTSTSRVLAPHTVQNAAAISDWLWQLVDEDPLLSPAHKPVILREIAAIGVTVPSALPVQYGALACIWRESVHPYLEQGQQASPMTMLMQLDNDQKPVIDAWIRQHGVKTWLTALVTHAYLPVMHMLWYHGTALESHAQNMLLIHESGLPVKVALKDFHDGVRYSRALLRDVTRLPELTDAPDVHAKVNPNSFLETDNADELRDFTQDALCFVNLGELAWFLQVHYQLPEQEFWSVTAKVMHEYQAAHPQLTGRFKLFDFFAANIEVEQLASRRFLPEVRLRVMSVENPLAKADQTITQSTQAVAQAV
ncbi:IucA/IucC family protein [Thalassomonas actiniarum]|uniref:Siderophore biosynthesis protein n=1 Tax=Thalassomonas actiniarum TaxID=485447 RepID=A0AAE9YR87_9GAMM|nr:IucA/IucC family protein [Thalassomonas actiniarum]WDD99769.1 siderophore biosynthesis protein [Thalassomonas actiniarum]